MKRSLPVLCLLLALPLCAVSVKAQSTSAGKTAPSIKGVWSIVEMDIGAGDKKETTMPKAFMMYIMDKHYSSIRDLSQREGSTSSGGAYGPPGVSWPTPEPTNTTGPPWSSITWCR